MRVRYATASASGWIVKQVAVVTVSGVVTPPTAKQIAADAGAWCVTHGLHAIVGRWAGAAIAIDGETLAAEMTAAPSVPGPRSIAIVCADDQMEIFNTHARLMRAAGHSRAVFTCDLAALAWAQEQARVRAYWASLRDGLRRAAPR